MFVRRRWLPRGTEIDVGVGWAVGTRSTTRSRRGDADNSPLCVELLVSPAWRTADDNPRGVLLRGDL